LYFLSKIQNGGFIQDGGNLDKIFQNLFFWQKQILIFFFDKRRDILVKKIKKKIQNGR
jgi:hypothetical protein